MLKNLSISTKLSITLLLCFIVPAFFIGAVGNVPFKKALLNSSNLHLMDVRDIKRQQAESMIRQYFQQVNALGDVVNSMNRSAFDKFEAVAESKRLQVETFIRNILDSAELLAENQLVARILNDFIYGFEENGNKIGGPSWNGTRDFYGFWLDKYKKAYSYNDILLISSDGNVVFSAAGSPEAGINLNKTSLDAGVLKTAFESGLNGISIQDFRSYGPAGNSPIMMISAPVKQLEEAIGVLVLKIDATPLNRIIQVHEGMGSTGETYIVGKAGGVIEYKSNRRSGKGKTGEKTNSRTAGLAMDGVSGREIQINETGEVELLYYSPLKLTGLQWVLVSSMSFNEILTGRSGDRGDNFYSSYLERFDFSDLFLIHKQGKIIFSLKEMELTGLNVFEDNLIDRRLRDAFDSAIKTGDTVVSDLISPHNEKDIQAYFAKLLGSKGQSELVIVLSHDFARLRKVIASRDGMGKTGSTYIIGPDNIPRTDRYSNMQLLPLSTILGNRDMYKVETDAVNSALKGKSGHISEKNENGTEISSFFSPIDFGRHKWAIISEMEGSEAFKPLYRLQKIIGGIVLLALFFVILFALMISRSITLPIIKGVLFAENISKGDLNDSLDINRDDELGKLAAALRKMKDNIRGIIKELSTGIKTLKSTSSNLNDVS